MASRIASTASPRVWARPDHVPPQQRQIERHPALGRVAGRMVQWSELAGGMEELLSLAETERTTIDMFEPATIAADMLREEAEAVGASIIISPNLPVVDGHRDLILHAVENLLSNAIKYREPSRPLGSAGATLTTLSEVEKSSGAKMSERIDRLELRDVHYMPEALDPGILYVSREFGSAAHLCACGCGTKVVTPIGDGWWNFTESEQGPTLSPSIGNWQISCRTHYWIRDGRVVWC